MTRKRVIFPFQSRPIFPLRQRDNSPSLTFTSEQEAAITRARFHKAQLLATALYDEGVNYEIACAMPDESWEILRKIARVNEPSLPTRVLACELLRDRDEQRFTSSQPDSQKPVERFGGTGMRGRGFGENLEGPESLS